MQTFISLLRGINVGGNKKIKMAELKTCYQSVGFTDVVTYIQSGNVVFNTTLNNLNEIQQLIEQAISIAFGFDVPVMVLSTQSLTNSVTQLPFTDVSVEQDGSQVMLCFLSKRPEINQLTQLKPYQATGEKVVLLEQVIYIHYPNGCARSKLTNNIIENKLKLTATTRNLKTASKLVALSQN